MEKVEDPATWVIIAKQQPIEAHVSVTRSYILMMENAKTCPGTKPLFLSTFNYANDKLESQIV